MTEREIIQPGNNPLVRDIERLREVNKWLRGEGPPPADLPQRERVAAVLAAPAADAPRDVRDRIAAWAAETGQVLDEEGLIIGTVPSPPASSPAPPREEPVLGFGKRSSVPLGDGRKVEFKRIRGIDYERGVVMIDDYEYTITEEEKRAVATFAVQVMLRELNVAIAQLVATSRAMLPGVPGGNVQQVRESNPKDAGETPVPAVPDAGDEHLEPAGGEGEGAPAA